LGLLAAAKAWALIDKRKAVLPEDLQAVLPAVAGHRLNVAANDAAAIVAPILKHVPVL
jgi:MoxR-like ATPase